MKRILLSTFSSLFAVAAVVSACSSSDDAAPTDTDVTDGGVDASSEIDGAIVADGSSDSSILDSGADAAPSTDVEITVLADNVPVVGATVVIGDSTGKMLRTVLTDAKGMIKETIAGGEMITVSSAARVVDAGTAASPDLVTIVGVKPGDKLLVPFYPGHQIPEVDVTLRSNGTATGYTARVGSTSAGNGTSVKLFLGNGDSTPLPGAPFSVLAMAYNAGGFIGGAFKKGQLLVPGAVTPVDFVSGAQPASADWSATFTNLTLTLANADTLPKGGFANGYPTMISDGIAFPPHVNDYAGATATATILSGFADSLQSTWFTRAAGDRQIVKRFANTLTTLPTDAADFLPEITVATPDITTPARPIMKWTPSAVATTDGVKVTVQAPDPLVDGYISWKLIGPSGANEMKLPELPAEMTLSTFALVDVMLVEADFVADYDQFRTAASVMANRDFGAFTGGSRTSGTLRTSSLYSAK